MTKLSNELIVRIQFSNYVLNLEMVFFYGRKTLETLSDLSDDIIDFQWCVCVAIFFC